MRFCLQRLGLALKLPPSYSSRLSGHPCEDKTNPFEIKSTANSLGSIGAFSALKTGMLLQRVLALLYTQMCSLALVPCALYQPLN